MTLAYVYVQLQDYSTAHGEVVTSTYAFARKSLAKLIYARGG